ncbi:MAG TPA: glycosyltransferase family 2 protein [Pirellulales bacterium]|nr:glycosyltransferase family 2 protein [Pirellulales bacterium]
MPASNSGTIDLSVVVPVYASAGTLPALVSRLRSFLDQLGRTYEMVFVDDASPDDSWRVLTDLQEANGGLITAVQLMRNFGQHNALMCGFRHCRGAYIVTLDDDLQNPPEEIGKLLQTIEARGLDVVYGRFQSKRHALARNVGSYLVNLFFRTVFRTPITVSCFRIMRREVLENILSYNLNFTYIDGLLAWNTQRIGEVDVEHAPREHGRSGYSPTKLVVLALNLFTNFSVLPLQVASGVGFLAATGGFAMGIYYLVQYWLSNIVVPGYASTIVAVFVLGGLQLLSLGLLGEYVGRLHLNVNRKPQYTVRQSRPAVGSDRDHHDNEPRAIAGQ